MENTMLSFHNDPAIKDKYVARVRAHQLADEIVKGQYWDDEESDGVFQGCAVGCTLHDSDHGAYETELGIPIILAKLEDGIFEGLPNDRAMKWPLEFLEAIPVGADLSNVWPQFAVWLLTDEKYGVLQYAKTDQSIKAVQLVADSYKRFSVITKDEWQKVFQMSVEAAAHAAAHAAAAAHAVVAAAHAAANVVVFGARVEHAVAAATHAAAFAGYAAAHAAAGYAAAHAAAAHAEAIAQSNHRVAQADKLLELLRQC